MVAGAGDGASKGPAVLERKGPRMLHFLVESQCAVVLREDGASAVKYAVMVATIAAVIIVVVVVLGEQVKSAFDLVSERLPQFPDGIIGD